jgi:hypothetical protein
MKFFGVGFLETAVTGVIGNGVAGVVSRCVDCELRAGSEPGCSGFGAGCMVHGTPPVAALPPTTERG